MSNPYEPSVSGDNPGHVPRSNASAGGSLMPWLLGAVVVLVLAVAGGLLTAWVVASMRAVPPPAGPSLPTAGPSVFATPTPTDFGQPTDQPTDAPRFTPTPSPLVTIEPEPFIHVVERGESLTVIAIFYEVEVADIIALNDISNPNRIQVGQELLIPGYGVRPSPTPG